VSAKIPTPTETLGPSRPTITATMSATGERARLPAVAPYIPYLSAFAIGDHVSHLQFGEGTVTEIDGRKLTIDFANRGTKQIVDDYVKRRKERKRDN
jgi:PcrA/UvrD tudor domain